MNSLKRFTTISHVAAASVGLASVLCERQRGSCLHYNRSHRTDMDSEPSNSCVNDEYDVAGHGTPPHQGDREGKFATLN